MKVAICHWSEGSASVLEVSTNAVSGHLSNHDDSLAALYYADVDGDGHGAGGATDRCPNAGLVDDATDCDDGDATVHPGAVEVAHDGIDNDCTGSTRDDDLDNDGYLFVDDCNDADPFVSPGEPESCDDGLDNNCVGGIDEGCEVYDCPCFTAADLDAALVTHNTSTGLYAGEAEGSLECAERHEQGLDAQGDPYLLDSTFVYMTQFTTDGTGLEGSAAQYYGLSYSGAAQSYATCTAFTTRYLFDGSNYTVNDQAFLEVPVTGQQAEDCESLLRAWAPDNGITCQQL